MSYTYGTISATTNTGTVVLFSPSTNEPTSTYFWDVVGATGKAEKMILCGDAGRTKVGTLEWNKLIELDGTDLDDIIVSGFYRVINPVNGPSGTSAIYLMVYESNSATIVQEATISGGINSSSDRKFFRKKANTWRSWIEFARTTGAYDQAITSTISWDGTPPSGASSLRYSWERVGNLVTVYMRLEYASAGTTNTTVTIDFPADLPTPAYLTGQNKGEIYANGAGALSTDLTGDGLTTRCVILRDGSGVYQLRMLASSNSMVGGSAVFSYITGLTF